MFLLLLSALLRDGSVVVVLSSLLWGEQRVAHRYSRKCVRLDLEFQGLNLSNIEGCLHMYNWNSFFNIASISGERK